MASVMIAGLGYPGLSSAVNIGDAVLISAPGEPLLVRVGLETESGEHIRNSCLSLLVPNPLQENLSNYLTEGSLNLQSAENRLYVDIRSPKPLDEQVSRLRLQIKCPGMRVAIKTLSLSPSAPAAVQETGKPPASPGLPALTLDNFPTEEISSKEGAILLARQKLLEAHFLALQHQVSQLQNEIPGINSQAGAAPYAASAPTPAPAPAAEPYVPQEKDQGYAPAPAAKMPAESQLRNASFLILGAILIALAIWIALHRRIKPEPRSKAVSHYAAEHVHKPAAEASPIQQMAPLHIAKPPLHIGVAAPAAATPPQAKPVHGAAALLHPAPAQSPMEEASEEDSMLEEAGLYANFGHASEAIEILHDITRRHPAKTGAWTLLLSIYSSLGKAAEFESTAREFLKHHPDNPSWEGLQALGRTLDRDNPLYGDQLHSAATGSRPSIGDILVETGVLSRHDVQNHLADFDPRRHGRFGGYLVTRKAITLAELDQALLQQQGVNTEKKPGTMPSLQDIEGFLAEFDPKLHGSVAEYMAAHNAATPEQLNRVLRQQSGHDDAQYARRDDSPPPPDWRTVP